MAAGAAEPGFAPVRYPVVIYYANETTEQAAQSQNYGALISTLRRSAGPRGAAIASDILDDARKFPSTVNSDVEALVAAARRLSFDLVVFTNAMALDHRYLFYRGDMSAPETRSLPQLPNVTSPALRVSPLSRSDQFAAALHEVASLYPHDSVDAVLITNSHGTPEMALMPRVSADMSLADPADIVVALENASGGHSQASWATLKGTDKIEYWRVIANASSADGMRFPLVFRQACDSGLWSWTEFMAIPRTVAAVAHTAMDNFEFGQVNYSRALGERENWLDYFGSALRSSGIHVDSRATLSRWLVPVTLRSIPVTFFFVPLALWLAWIAGSRHVVARAGPTSETPACRRASKLSREVEPGA